MRRRLERRLWIGVALVAVLAGATAAAVMAAQPAAKHVRHHSSHRHRGDRSHMRAAVHPAALYLGVTVTQLREDVRSGKTLAQVANSTSGKSEAGLIEAILAARKAALAAKAKAGGISQARVKTVESRLDSRVKARVQDSHRLRRAARRARAHKR